MNVEDMQFSVGVVISICSVLIGGLIGTYIEFKIKHPDFEKELNEDLEVE